MKNIFNKIIDKIYSLKISYRITLIYTTFFLFILLFINIIVSSLTNVIILGMMKNELLNQRDYVFAQLQQYNTFGGNIINLKNLLLSLNREDKYIYSNIKYQKNDYYWTYENMRIKIPLEKDLNSINIYRLDNGSTFLYLNSKYEEGDLKINLQLIKDITELNNFYTVLRMILFLTSIIALITSIFLGKVLTKSILVPIKNITNTSKDITAKNLDKRIALPENDDEITELINVINTMIERLEISFKNQSKFISDASHELRTPLSVINGYIDILDSWGKDNKEILDESIVTIKDEVMNMTNLIERLLFIAREDNKKIQLNLDKINIKELIDKISKDTKLIDKNKHNFTITNEIEYFIYADKKLILQLIRIILENSIKYTEPGGEIKIYTYLEAEDRIAIVIEDTGIGIPKEGIPNLFNRFYRVDESRAKKTGGTGLGLSIAKSIVDMHNGDIFIESELGKGTKTTIILSKKREIEKKY
ncbi:MAG: two-component sensor histidine kinase [Fusobacteriales bacterium]|jgi:signal transduction histidine kinase|nr:two-component sensor histidine kinase [Fusobacteriales bacterium]